MAKKPIFPKPLGDGYRRPVEGNDANLGGGHFEARVRVPTDLGSGIVPRGDRPAPLWTQFLSPKEYTWIYQETITDIATSDLTQQVLEIDPGSSELSLVILEFTPILLRPKPGNVALKEAVEPIEYANLIVASMLIGGKSPIASSIPFVQGASTLNIPATRYMNRKAYSFDPTFPVVAYGNAGEVVTVNFYYAVAANGGSLPGGTDLDVGAVITGLAVPTEVLKRIYDYMRI